MQKGGGGSMTLQSHYVQGGWRWKDHSSLAPGPLRALVSREQIETSRAGKTTSPGFCPNAQELTSNHTCACSTHTPHTYTHTIYFFFSLSVNINWFSKNMGTISVRWHHPRLVTYIFRQKKWEALKLKAGLFVRSNFTCDTHLWQGFSFQLWGLEFHI